MYFIIVTLLFNNVYQRDARIGRPEIVFMTACLESTACGTIILVKLRVDIAYADIGLNIPALAQKPGVAVGDACACSPALIAMILSRLAAKRNPDSADIVIDIACVNAEEMSVEAFTKPITVLRHHHPMLQLLVAILVESPRIVATRDVKGGVLTKTEFHAKVRRST